MSDTFLQVRLEGIIERLDGELAAAQAEVERLRATNAELVAVLDAAWLVLKGRDQREDEMRVYNAIRIVLAKAGGKDA